MLDGGLKLPFFWLKLLCTSHRLSDQALLLYLSDVTILCDSIAFRWSSLALQK